MIRRPPRSTQSRSSAASDVYKRQDPHSLRTHQETHQSDPTVHVPSILQNRGREGDERPSVGHATVFVSVGLSRVESGELRTPLVDLSRKLKIREPVRHSHRPIHERDIYLTHFQTGS